MSNEPTAVNDDTDAPTDAGELAVETSSSDDVDDDRELTDAAKRVAAAWDDEGDQ